MKLTSRDFYFMIIEFELSQVIKCPLEKVFSFLKDFTNMPMWNYYIQTVTKITDGSVRVGTVYEQKRPHDLIRYKVISINEPYSIMAELLPPAPHLCYGFTLSAKEAGTQVNYKWQLDLERYKLLKYIPKGNFKDWLLSFADKQIQRKTKPAVQQNFEKLRQLLETGTVTLQDGRIVELENK